MLRIDRRRMAEHPPYQRNSPQQLRSCEKIEIKFDCGSPRPGGERGWGVRGIAVLPQRAFVFPHLERFFSLSWNSMRHASPPSPLAPLPRWGEGNRDRLIFSHLLTHYCLSGVLA